MNQSKIINDAQAFVLKSRLIIPALIFAFSCIVTSIGLNLVGQTITEIQIINQGRSTLASFVNRPILTFLNNPASATKLVYGLVVKADQIDLQNNQPIYNYDWAYSRLISMILSALSLSVFYSLLATNWSFKQRLIAVTILGLVPPFISNSQQISYLPLMLLLFLLTWWTLKQLLNSNYKNPLLVLFLALSSLFFATLPRADNNSIQLIFNQLKLFPLILPLLKLFASLPSIIIALLLIGVVSLLSKNSVTKRTEILLALVVPLILYLGLHHASVLGLILPSLSLLTVLGVEQLSHMIPSPNWPKLINGMLLLGLVFALIQSFPYYGQYANLLVGGSRGVYDKRLYSLGIDGDGQREAGVWLINHAIPNAIVGEILYPSNQMPPMDDVMVLPYVPKFTYDYLLLSTASITQGKINPQPIYEAYDPVYQVQVDNAPLITIFERKIKPSSSKQGAK